MTGKIFGNVKTELGTFDTADFSGVPVIRVFKAGKVQAMLKYDPVEASEVVQGKAAMLAQATALFGEDISVTVTV